MLSTPHDWTPYRAALVLAAVLLLPASSMADERRSCFATGSPAFPVSGDVLRQAALRATIDKRNADTALTPQPVPLDPLRCSGASDNIPAPAPGNYFGTIDNKVKFRRLARMDCNGAGLTTQFFSMGKAIYYRSCQAGPGINYIYFWGKQDGRASTCFGSTYPEMFTVASSSKTNPLTLDRVTKAFNGGLTGDDQSTFALGNIMAALQVSEAARDYLVTPINYMLFDQAADTRTSLTQILAGHCVPGAAHCGNKADEQDGAHPLAWGGAQADMMTGGGWGTNNGATSEFGKAFETDLIVNWLKGKKAISAGNTDCIPTRSYDDYPPEQRRKLLGLFDRLF